MPIVPPGPNAAPPGAQPTNPYLQFIEDYFRGNIGGVIGQTNAQVGGLQTQNALTGLTLGSQGRELGATTGEQIGALQYQGQNYALQNIQSQLQSGLNTQLYGYQTKQYELGQQTLEQQLGSHGQLAWQKLLGLSQAQTGQVQSGVGGGGSTGTQQQRSDVQKQYAWNVANVQRQLASNVLGQKAATASYQEQQQNLALGRQITSNLAAANNLSEAELSTRLNYGLAQLGLQGKMSASQMLTQIAQARGTEQTDIMQTLAPVFYLSGINASQLLHGILSGEVG
jgi:hypothetical protein